MAQYGTTEVAQACGISLNTVRQWANDYSAFLSPNARGEQGDRTFSTHDLEVLKYVAQLRSERMRKDAIVQRLGETTFPEVAARQTDIVSIEQPPAQEAHHAAPALPLALLDLEKRIDAKFDRLERSRQPSFVSGIGIGFIAAAIFFLIIVLVGSMYGGFR